MELSLQPHPLGFLEQPALFLDRWEAAGRFLIVLRFGNYDVDHHFDNVCATIQPSPGGEGAPVGGG